MYNNSPKTLLFDLEVSPSRGWVYGKYEQTVLEFDRYQWVQCMAYKWLDGKHIHVIAQPDFPRWSKDRFDDSGILKILHTLIEKSDIVVAHNGKKFDIRKANTGFIRNHLDPPRPYKILDTLTIARSKFGFTGNSLNDLAVQLGVGRKLELGAKDLWQQCMNGDMKSWRQLKKYCVHDVKLLEGIYKIFLPWIDPFPKLRPFTGNCKKCGETHLHRRGPKWIGGKLRSHLKCLSCGAWQPGEVIQWDTK